MLDFLKSTISGQQLEHADPDGAEWYEGELMPAPPPTSIPMGTMESPASYRAKIAADVAQQYAERAERDRERQARR